MIVVIILWRKTSAIVFAFSLIFESMSKQFFETLLERYLAIKVTAATPPQIREMRLVDDLGVTFLGLMTFGKSKLTFLFMDSQ